MESSTFMMTLTGNELGISPSSISSGPRSPSCLLFEDDDSRWQAVVSRDAAADGLFFYAVKTTKIFCRPICKARLARRANVSFYRTGREAVTAGFRACKRCKPELEGAMPEDDAVRKIRNFVREQEWEHHNSIGSGTATVPPEPGAVTMSLSRMARQTGLSKWHFHRVFKKCVGKTPVEYLRHQRLESQVFAITNGLDGQSWLADGALAEDFDTSLWPGAFGDSESGGSRTPSTTISDGNTWSIDDLLIWPDESLK